jgi:hypothetical protein
MHDVTRRKPSAQFNKEKLCSYEENLWIGRVRYVMVEEYGVVLVLTKSLRVQNGTFLRVGPVRGNTVLGGRIRESATNIVKLFSGVFDG